MPKTCILIATYNEKENIEKIIKEILKLNVEGINIMVLDDNSPDGTSEIVRDIGICDKRVKLLLRKAKRGRGLAGKEGFLLALSGGADYILEMDADFSHDPKYIPKILEELKGNDLVIGSRIVEGGIDKRGNPIRKIITFLSNLYIRIMLGIKVRDCNSGYRGFTREALKKIEPEKIFSKGPDIIQEVLYKAHLKKLRIKEIPIEFPDRELGKSKLGIKHLYKGYTTVLKLKLLHLFGRI